MAINVSQFTDAALKVVFGLGSDIVKEATYYRPASLNPRTGAITSIETRAAVQVIIGNPGHEFGGSTQYPGDKKLLIQASELVAISNPGPSPGDFIILTGTGQRYDVVEVVLDRTGKLYSFQVAPSVHEDFGDLTASGTADDWGDLTAVTAFEDRGGLVGAIV